MALFCTQRVKLGACQPCTSPSASRMTYLTNVSGKSHVRQAASAIEDYLMDRKWIMISPNIDRLRPPARELSFLEPIPLMVHLSGTTPVRIVNNPRSTVDAL